MAMDEDREPLIRPTIDYASYRMLALEEAACGDPEWRRKIADVRRSRELTFVGAPRSLRFLDLLATAGCLTAVLALGALVATGFLADAGGPGFRIAMALFLGGCFAGTGARAMLKALLHASLSSRRALVLLGSDAVVRPDPVALAKTLTELGGEDWEHLTARMEAQGREPPGPSMLEGGAASPAWDERLVAMNGLAAEGERAVAALLAMAGDEGHPARERAAALLERRVRQPSRLARAHAHFLVCRECLSHVRPQMITRALGRSFDYFACGVCRGTEHLVEAPGGITAVLGGEDQVREIEGAFEMNPLERKRPFELDRLRVETADEAAIEALALRIENDTDDARRERNRKAPVEVVPGVELGERALTLLARTFPGSGGALAGEPGTGA